MLKFDELNKLYTNASAKIHSTPYIKYFEKMLIPEEEKERRVEVAEKLEPVFLFIFALIDTTVKYEYEDVEFVIEQLKTELKTVVEDLGLYDEHMEQYVDNFSDLLVKTTYNNLEEFSTEDYYLSDDRAIFISENEANTLCNYEDLQEALESGYKYKTWITMRDNRVRASHAEVDDITIPIDEMFEVGNSLMMYPHDELNAPEECVSCRCSMEFS